MVAAPVIAAAAAGCFPCKLELVFVKTKQPAGFSCAIVAGNVIIGMQCDPRVNYSSVSSSGAGPVAARPNRCENVPGIDCAKKSG